MTQGGSGAKYLSPLACLQNNPAHFILAMLTADVDKANIALFLEKYQ